MTTTPAHTHVTQSTLNERLMHKPRVCRDCRSVYRYSDYSNTHHNPRYCAACLPQHPRRCATCKQPFHPARDADRLCPIHTVHSALFERPS